MIELMHKKQMVFKPLFKDANASLVKCRNGCQIEPNETRSYFGFLKVDGH